MAQVPAHQGHVFFGGFTLTSLKLLIDRTLKLMFYSQSSNVIWIGPPLNRFVDFFVVVPKSLSEVNYKSINWSFAFGSG